MTGLKITIDTNLLIYLFDLNLNNNDALKSCILIKTILNNSSHVAINTQVSTSVEDDLFQDKEYERKKAILFRIQNIFQQISPGEIIFQNKKIILKDKNDNTLFQELRRILFPNLDSSDKTYINKVNDLKHLFSHIKNERDIYITNDSDFLKDSKRNALKVFNTQIMSPDEFIQYLNSYSNKGTYTYKSAPKRHDYQNSALKGIGEMNFTNNNGLYLIGSGDFLFEIKWGECSSEKMRVYNDPQTIEAIALAEDKKFKEVLDDKFYDFTDRCREPRKKVDTLILKNSKGYFAGIKIIDFKVKDRGDDKNYLKFEYIINTRNRCNFKKTG